MINTITFNSQVAMAGALSSILGGKQGITESAKARQDDKVIVESDQNGAATASATTPVASNKPESKPEKTAEVKKVCESDTAQSRLDKFRAEHKEKKFGKKLKTCSCSKTVCECGDQKKPKFKIAGAPVENPPEGGDAGAAPAAGGMVGEATQDVDKKDNTEENVEATDANASPAVGNADAGTDAGIAGAEGDDSDAGDDNGEEDRKELVAHASAVSERMASLKEKLVAELDADDGLKLDNQENGEQDDGEVGSADAGDAEGNPADEDN